jgi:threonine/homoserine/homoserine lactone efflux protein
MEFLGIDNVFGIPLLLAIVILVVGLLLVRTAVTLVKVLIIVGIAVVAWLGISWLLDNLA